MQQTCLGLSFHKHIWFLIEMNHYSGWHSGTMVITVASQQEGPGQAVTLCVCVGSLQVLQFPLTIQNM